MTPEERSHPRSNQPLNAEPRSQVVPVLAAAGLVVLIVAIFLLITTIAYNT